MNITNKKKVISFEKLNKNEYKGIVKGEKKYKTYINIEEVEKSTCSCPFAQENDTICKHQVALYFTAFPKEAENFIKTKNISFKENKPLKIVNFVFSLNEEELQKILVLILNECPEWMYNKYIKYPDIICDDYIEKP